MKKSDIIKFNINNSLNNRKWNSEFITQNRYFPILKIVNNIYLNPLLLEENSYLQRLKYISNYLNYYNFSYRINFLLKSKKRYIDFSLFLGYFSIIGISNLKWKNINYFIRSTFRTETFQYDAKYDILVLGVVDVNTFKKNDFSNFQFNLNKKKITLLVSDKVWKNDDYCSKYYSKSLRKHIKSFLTESEQNGMMIKVVPHDYLNKFISSKSPQLKTTSFTTIKGIEHDVKEDLFSNLKIQDVIEWK